MRHTDRPTLQHLVERFFRSIRPGGPSPRSLAFARQTLAKAEWELFVEMAGFDQRHAIGVARAARSLTGSNIVARAGLMHDIGKIDCHMGPAGRAVATVVRYLLPVTSANIAYRWWLQVLRTTDGRLRPRRLRDRWASYWLHPWIGRRMLEHVGADPRVAAWAEQHHWIYVSDDLVFVWDEAAALWDSDCD